MGKLVKNIVNFLEKIDVDFDKIISKLVFCYDNLNKRPFFIPSLMMVIGIIFENNYNISIAKLTIIQIFSVISAIIIMIYDRKKYINLSLYFLIFICGITLATLFNYQNYNISLNSYIGKNVLIHGKLERNYIYQNGMGGIIKTDYLIINNDMKKCIGKIKFNSKFTKEIILNSELFIEGKLLPIRSFHNFDRFSYEEITKKRGVLAMIKNGKIIPIKGSCSIFDKFRNGVINSLKLHFSKYLSPVKTSLILSIILGSGDYNSEIISIFKESGLIHLLVVSGFHITVILTILLFFFYGNLGIIITIFSLIIYLFLVNFTPSVSRAIFMSIVMLSGKLLNKKSDNLNSLFFSFFILIVSNPNLIYNMGFCLTYSITFSIIFIYPQFPKEWNEWMRISITVIVGMSPITMIFLGYTNLTTIISSPIGMVICELILFYSLMVIPFLYLPIPIVFILLKPLEFLVDLLFYSAKLFSNYSFYFSNFSIYKIAFIIFTVIILNFIIDRFIKFEMIIKYIFFLIFIFLFLIYSKTEKNFSLDFMDIGQGDTILFENGDKSFFIDVGDDFNHSFDKAIKPYLLRNSINIDSIIITHIDKDHSGNSGKINNLFKKVKFYFPITLKHSSEFEIFIKNKNIGRKQIFFLKSGDILKFNSIILKILWPKVDNYVKKRDDNYNSLVILAKTPVGKILLMGDTPKSIERKITKLIDGNIDILKVSHHGSKSGTTLNFLRRIKPKFSIISAGFLNRYKHPNQEVIYNLSKSGTSILDTISCGMIRFMKKNGKNIVVKSR